MDDKGWPGDFCHCSQSICLPHPSTTIVIPVTILQYKIIMITIFLSVLCSVVVNVLCLCFLKCCHSNKLHVLPSGMRWLCVRQMLSLWTVWCYVLLCQWCHLSVACRATEMLVRWYMNGHYNGYYCCIVIMWSAVHWGGDREAHFVSTKTPKRSYLQNSFH
jgi:hypothetical protein